MNFIFFIPDELRAESVGCYGHPLAPTPNIDRLWNDAIAMCPAWRRRGHRAAYLSS